MPLTSLSGLRTPGVAWSIGSLCIDTTDIRDLAGLDTLTAVWGGYVSSGFFSNCNHYDYGLSIVYNEKLASLHGLNALTTVDVSLAHCSDIHVLLRWTVPGRGVQCCVNNAQRIGWLDKHHERFVFVRKQRDVD